ncbi:transporter substrate-binding domain-containing protein [Arcanobacterium hippocoleae]
MKEREQKGKTMRRGLAAMTAGILALGISACSATGGNSASNAKSGGTPNASGLIADGKFTIAMEAAYAPYNWEQPDNANAAVKIDNSTGYANGYDVLTAKEIAAANGWELHIVKQDWDSLIPALQAGTIDAVIAGQSMTAQRMEEVDFAGPYLYANIVVLTKAGSQFADAKGISELSGGKVTSQTGTIWYDTLIPQIPDANRLSPAESAPAMLMALQTGQVDYVVTDMPTAQSAVKAYPEMKILNFSDSADNFKVSDEDINIGIAVKKEIQH